MRQPNTTRNQWGYTLLEVFFAVFVIVFVLLSLSAMTTMVMNSNSMNDFADTAIDLAQDKVEELKNALPTSSILADLNPTNNSDLESTSNVDFQESSIDGLGQVGGIYTRTWNIADNNPKSGMKTVVVIVSWTDQMGGHSVSLRTIL
ncbi:MAG: hypothetical protein ACE5JU_01115 [Candidatus Binatia bacterium]